MTDDRRPCDWCGLLTARSRDDGTPRHGWCETPPTRIWRNVPRPKPAEEVGTAVQTKRRGRRAS
jgi:hypothetical protein